MNQLKTIFIPLGITILVILGVVAFGFFSNPEPITSPTPTEEIVGGLTKTRIGSQTYWTTDLVPSGSFSVNLGSVTVPVNKGFFTNASVSGNFEVGNRTLFVDSITTTDYAVRINATDSRIVQFTTSLTHTGGYLSIVSGAHEYFNFGIHKGTGDYAGTGQPGDIYISAEQDNAIIFASYGYEKMRIQSDTNQGNVGIGTIAPNYKLAVAGTASISSGFFGSGLVDCDAAATSKLLWDSTTGKFSCGTDANTTYTGGDHLTLTGTDFDVDDDFLLNTGDTATGLVIFSAGASVSTNFEVSGTASISALTLGNKLDFSSYVNATAGTGILFSGDDIGFDCSEVEGTGINCTGEAITLDATGDWTGTLDTKNAADFLWLTGGTLTGGLFGTTGSFSGNFEISGTASISNIVGQGQFSGFGLADCDNATDSKLLWDVTSGKFSCGTDQDTGGGGGVASNSLDFDEFVNAMTLDANLSVASAGFNTTWNGRYTVNQGEFRVRGTDIGEGNTWSEIEIGENNVTRGVLRLYTDSGGNATIQTTSGQTGSKVFLIPDTGGTAAVLAGAQTFTGVKTFSVGASVSTNLEVGGYASISQYLGAGITGAGYCNDATDKLLYDSATELFSCGTLSVADTSATGGTGIDISTNDFVFDATELEALTWGAGGNASNVWTFNLSAGDPTLTWTTSGASLSSNFEILGYASASAYYGEQTLWKGTIASTSNEWFNGGRIPLSWDGGHYIITKIYCSVDVATSVVINISNMTGTYDTETVTCDVDGASDTAIGTNPSYASFTVASSSLEFGTITGTPDYLIFTIKGKVLP